MNADGTIDFSKLEKDLLVAVEEDARYQRENDAKFRAVEQKVASYEEFKDIVAASHLRPLDKKDREGLHSRKQPWNPYAEKHNGRRPLKIDNPVTQGVIVPKNSHEFLKQWRQYGKDGRGKYCYLMRTGGLKLCEIFKAEIPMGLLGEIVDILYQNWNTEDHYGIYQILHELSTVKRFNISLQFLSDHEKQMLTKLFEELENGLQDRKEEIDTKIVIDEKSLEALKKIYEIKT